MDIEYLSKNYSKEQIYRIYEAVSESFKKYNQITRKQCLLKIQEAYKDKDRWSRMALLQTASCGKFTSDRTIQQYVDEIWKLEKVTVEL